MAHRDAEHSGVGGERRCPAEHVHGPACRHPRGAAGEPAGERSTASPRPDGASAEDSAAAAAPAGAGGSECRTDRPGWAGTHRHGGVRPRPPAGRPLRPPGRWC